MEPFAISATLLSVRDFSTDENMWANVLSGDGEAFGVLFDRHRQRVFRHSYRLVESAADADDLVSVVFLEAWRRRYSMRFVEESMLPWLLVTATNTARNFLRKRRRYQEVLSDLPVKFRDDSEFFDTIDGDVAGAFASLSLIDQRVLTLCVLEQYSERDAAQA